MKIPILVCCVVVAAVAAENDWVWNDQKQRSSRIDNPRYQIHENLEDLDNEGPLIGFRPQNAGPYGPDSRPIVPAYQGNKGVLVGPGGPTGIIKRPHYPGNSHVGDGISDPGFLPSWIKDDPRYREYDTCRCRYSFNCPSNGLKFGVCSKDKRYCCFNSRKYPNLVPGGGHPSNYPGSPHKYGPVGFGPSSGYYGNRRPHGSVHSGHRNPPGNYHFSQPAGSNFQGNYDNPYDRDYDYDSSDVDDGGPGDFDFYGRSLNKNETSAQDGKMSGRAHT